jgi:acyl dehydratase
MPFTTPVEDRYFEDYVPGDVHEFGSIVAEESEMIAFARRFDPQPFHPDPVAAKQLIFVGLIASGWYTASLMMRLFVSPTFTQRERRTSK